MRSDQLMKGEGSEQKTSLAEERTELAEGRTDFAEDRTVMANERTFAGWMRTGLAAVGIGLGFNALFGKMEPSWAPRSIATLFILIGVFVFWAAQHNGYAVHQRLKAHQAEPLRGMSMRLIAGAMSLGSLALVAAIWLLNLSN
jgi:putative membrane protein